MDTQPEPYKLVQWHWFYKQTAQGKELWKPFSTGDSQRLEEAHTRGSDDEVVVATEGRRYDVRLKERRLYAVYWDQAPCEVRRCSWFHKGNKELFFTPYTEEISELLEEAYMISVSLNEWKNNIQLPTGENVILHNPKLMTQQLNFSLDCPPSPSERTQPRTLKRGVENIPVEIPQEEPDTVDHLVFMVHGIGPACDMRLRGIVQCVNEFRSTALALTKSHFSSGDDNKAVGRVEFLPVNWHRVLHGETTGVDRDIERITLPSIRGLRQFANDTVLDLFFYNSATYCQTIVDTVASEINHLHSIFLQRNPQFTGAVSVAGHSLGSLILFDLLTNQRTEGECTNEDGQNDKDQSSSSVADCTSCESLEEALMSIGTSQEHLKILQREQMDLESLVLCSESDLRGLGIPFGPCKKIINCVKKWKHSSAAHNKKHSSHTDERKSSETRSLIRESQPKTSSVDYQHFDVGIGQVSINYPQLSFHPQAFFAFGSPIGMFLIVRGLKRIDPNYSFPTCSSFYNIFHPFDPVAYRIEPMILDPDVEAAPMLMSHHKGRKRMHLELREGLTRVGSDLLGSLRTVWQSFSQHPAPALAEGNDMATAVCTAEEMETSPLEQEEKKMIEVGKLNGGRRIDYVLQEKPIESFNEYLFAIQSHLCYWESEDTALLLLKAIYGNGECKSPHQ